MSRNKDSCALPTPRNVSIRAWLIDTIVRSIGTTCRHTSAGIVTNYGGALLWSNGLSMKVDEVHDNKGDNHSD